MTAKSLVRITLLAGAMALAAPVFAADPSMHDVYVAAEAGKYTEAQAMMDEVLKAHPNSGKAHFVEAELLAKQGKFSAAQGELSTAEKLSPGLSFAKPEAVTNLRALLAKGQAAPASYAQQPVRSNNGYANNGYNNRSDSGLPWGTLLILGLGLVGFIVFASRFMARRQAEAQAYNPGYSPAPPAPGYPPGTYPQQGYGPGYGPGYGQPAQPGIGSRIAGGLATGAAVGAGIVAGEALMHHFTDGDRNANAADRPRNDIVYDDPSRDDLLKRDDMGGNDFGVSDSGSWDDGGGGGGGGSDWD